MTVRSLSSRREAGYVVLSVAGEVDLSWSSELRRAILGALREGKAVLVDLRAVTYIDSSGVAALVEGYQTARGEGRGFGLVAISDPVRAVLELARLDRVFPIHESTDAARR